MDSLDTGLLRQRAFELERGKLSHGGGAIVIDRCVSEIERLRSELAEARAETVRQCAAYLRRAADDHRAKAKEERSLAARGGNELAASVLDGWANAMEIDVPRNQEPPR